MRPPYLCRPESSSASPAPTDLSPRPSSRVRRNTTDEWPREKKKPTLIGRWPSGMSLRVVLSIAAMWSASKACRMPRVYAVSPRPTPSRWPPTWCSQGATTRTSSPQPITCSRATKARHRARLRFWAGVTGGRATTAAAGSSTWVTFATLFGVRGCCKQFATTHRGVTGQAGMGSPGSADRRRLGDREGAAGGGFGDRPVGRHQPDPRAPVEEVPDVGGPFVGDAEDELGERRRDARTEGRERLLTGQPVPERVGEHQGCLGAEAADQSRGCVDGCQLRSRASAQEREIAGAARAATQSTHLHGPADGVLRHPAVGGELATDDGHDAGGG